MGPRFENRPLACAKRSHHPSLPPPPPKKTLGSAGTFFLLQGWMELFHFGFIDVLLILAAVKIWSYFQGCFQNWKALYPAQRSNYLSRVAFKRSTVYIGRWLYSTLSWTVAPSWAICAWEFKLYQSVCGGQDIIPEKKGKAKGRGLFFLWWCGGEIWHGGILQDR